MIKFVLLGLLFSSLAGAADTYVNGYYRSSGTYVQPHYQTAPDSNPFNNYSTQGNINPYTGKVGTANPYITTPTVYPRAADWKNPYEPNH